MSINLSHDIISLTPVSRWSVHSTQQRICINKDGKGKELVRFLFASLIKSFFPDELALKQGHATRPLAVVQKRNLGGIGRDRDEAVPFWDQ